MIFLPTLTLVPQREKEAKGFSNTLMEAPNPANWEENMAADLSIKNMGLRGVAVADSRTSYIHGEKGRRGGTVRLKESSMHALSQ